MELTISKVKMPVMDKRISKTFAELTDVVKQNITNKVTTQEMCKTSKVN